MASRRNHENPNPDTTNEVRPDDGPIRRHRPEEPTEVEAFLGRNWSTMNQKARSLTRNVDAANDLVQQASQNIIRSFRSHGSFREGGNERAWLRKILVNQNIANHRGKASSEVSLDAMIEASERGARGADGPIDPSDMAESVVERLECEALSPILAKALSTLSDRQREAFHLRVIKELEWSEVAEAMHCTEHKARSFYSNACKSLRKKVAAMGVTENYGGEGE